MLTAKPSGRNIITMEMEMDDNAIKEKSIIGKWKLKEVKVKDNKADKTSDALKGEGWMEINKEKSHDFLIKNCGILWKDTREDETNEVMGGASWQTVDEKLMLDGISSGFLREEWQGPDEKTITLIPSYEAPSNFTPKAPGRKSYSEPTKLDEGGIDPIGVFLSEVYDMTLSKGTLTLTFITKHTYLSKSNTDTDYTFSVENFYTRTHTYTFEKIK